MFPTCSGQSRKRQSSPSRRRRFWAQDPPDVYRMMSEVIPGTKSPEMEVIMARSILGLAVALLIVAPVGADELDREFAGKARTPVLVKEKAGQPPSPQTGEQAGAAKASELDQDSPAQAYRGYH